MANKKNTYQSVRRKEEETKDVCLFSKRVGYVPEIMLICIMVCVCNSQFKYFAISGTALLLVLIFR